jgi:aminoglycoside phosphotransferase (APT) family kinase protein
LSASLPEPVLRFFRKNHLAGADEVPAAAALSGGVSSDIWRVELARGPVCVKRALPKLRVAQAWEAPIERNRYEAEWFRVAGEAAPRAVPKVLAQGDDLFVMQYLDPGMHPVWKAQLKEGHADPGFAARVGGTLAAIHAATAGREAIARLFPTDRIFYDIRLEPYLVFTGSRFPELQEQFDFLVRRTANTRLCLVHGDVSPKNILCGPEGPVFLDAECAWYGDPAFDLAFCLNHLLLKCLWVPSAMDDFLGCFTSLTDRYLPDVTWEDRSEIERRAASLLPALLLARVDGKSPVEYVTQDAQKEIVRQFARQWLSVPASRLDVLRDAWQRSLK